MHLSVDRIVCLNCCFFSRPSTSLMSVLRFIKDYQSDRWTFDDQLFLYEFIKENDKWFSASDNSVIERAQWGNTHSMEKSTESTTEQKFVWWAMSMNRLNRKSDWFKWIWLPTKGQRCCNARQVEMVVSRVESNHYHCVIVKCVRGDFDWQNILAVCRWVILWSNKSSLGVHSE